MSTIEFVNNIKDKRLDMEVRTPFPYISDFMSLRPLQRPQGQVSVRRDDCEACLWQAAKRPNNKGIASQLALAMTCNFYVIATLAETSRAGERWLRRLRSVPVASREASQ